MADNDWTRDELEAAVEAYLQMLRLEQAGLPCNKSAVRRMLLAGPLQGRSTSEQRMQNISHVLDEMGLGYIDGYKPLANVGKQKAVIREILERHLSDDAPPIPRFPAKETRGGRTTKDTGYWMLASNPRTWDVARWFASDEDSLLYKVSMHHLTQIQPGDLALLAVSAKSGPDGHPKAIFGIFEAEEAPSIRADDDRRFWIKGDPTRLEPRARFRLLADLSEAPLPVSELPDTNEFTYLHTGLPTSTLPLSRAVFQHVFRVAKVDAQAVYLERSSASIEGASQLEARAAKDTPTRKERVSQAIERGIAGQRVKEARGGRCQVCEKIGREPIAFLKPGGAAYAEAHHVFPVSEMRDGSLASWNIMVLCPNHHRQAHYGDFQILEHRPGSWLARIDQSELEIERTALKIS